MTDHDRRKALTSKYSSKPNKLWLCVAWGVEWRWQGEVGNSRFAVLFDGRWHECQSYEEDIKPTLKFGKEPT